MAEAAAAPLVAVRAGRGERDAVAIYIHLSRYRVCKSARLYHTMRFVRITVCSGHSARPDCRPFPPQS